MLNPLTVELEDVETPGIRIVITFLFTITLQILGGKGK